MIVKFDSDKHKIEDALQLASEIVGDRIEVSLRPAKVSSKVIGKFPKAFFTNTLQSFKHHGPGPHPGTDTDQSIHSPDVLIGKYVFSKSNKLSSDVLEPGYDMSEEAKSLVDGARKQLLYLADKDHYAEYAKGEPIQKWVEEVVIGLTDYYSRTLGIDHDEGKALLDKWFGTSSQHLELQKAAMDVFHVDSPEHLKKQEDYDDTKPVDVMKKLLREMYQRTQREFGNLHIDEVVLYRGVRNRDLVNLVRAGKLKMGDKIPIEMNPLSSWTSDYDSAKAFGRIILACRIPTSRILSSGSSGFGAPELQEFVVVGGIDGDEAAVLIS